MEYVWFGLSAFLVEEFGLLGLLPALLLIEVIFVLGVSDENPRAE